MNIMLYFSFAVKVEGHKRKVGAPKKIFPEFAPPHFQFASYAP